MAREPGYRSKVAVSSSDQRVDCVGACVGVRGNRIKNIVDELAGERIDIVRWNDDPEVLIPNALQPAEVDQVLLCDMIGRAIVLVREDQLSLAIGRRGQNVRLASKLCGWDIEIMTADELEEQIERAVGGFSALEGVNEELAQALVEQGYLSYDDLSVIEPDALMEMGGLTAEQVDRIVEQAEQRAEEAEQAAAAERRRQRTQQQEQVSDPGPPAESAGTGDEHRREHRRRTPTRTPTRTPRLSKSRHQPMSRRSRRTGRRRPRRTRTSSRQTSVESMEADDSPSEPAAEGDSDERATS